MTAYCPQDNLPFFYEKEGTENGFAILSGVTVVTVTPGQKKPVLSLAGPKRLSRPTNSYLYISTDVTLYCFFMFIRL